MGYFFGKYEDGLKSSNDDVISTVDDLIDRWDPSTAKLMEEMYGP